MKLTQDALMNILEYDPKTGLFVWRKRDICMFSHCKSPDGACSTWNTRFSGTVAGSTFKLKKANTPYVAMSININGVKGRRYLAHSLAFLYMNGTYAKMVDHIDHDGTNNSWDNIREVTHKENKKNMTIGSANTSGFVGVTWNKNKGKWQVQLAVTDKNGKRSCVYGGLFVDKEEAIEKRKKMNIEYNFHENHGK